MDSPVWRLLQTIRHNGSFAALRVCAFTALLASTGCVTQIDVETVTATTRSNNLPDCLVNLAGKLKRVRHAQPLVGVFLGVGNYSKESKLWPTPAHAISAALFREPFYVSARTAEMRADLRLVTDLTIDRRTSDGKSTEDALRRLDGVRDRLATPVASDSIWGSSGTAMRTAELDAQPVFRGAIAMTRTNLLAELDSALALAEATAAQQGRVVFFFYISAHGRLGRDGTPYILPSGALPDDPSSWIEQQEIVARTRTFLARSSRDGLARKAILVFDICRHFLEGVNDTRQARPSRGLPNAILVESTSPQTYAWQWELSAETQSATRVLKDASWGFPFPPRSAERSPVEIALASRISIAPLASSCSITQFFVDKGSTSFDRLDKKSNAMSAAQWVISAADTLEKFAKLVPEMQEKGERQQLQFHAAANLEWMPLLEVLD